MKTYDAYLVGYYGMQNSGDDALMYAAAWGAQSFLNSQKIILSAPRNLQIPDLGIVNGCLSGKQAFRGHHRLQHYFAAAKSDRVIFGGGSVLHHERDIRLKMDLMKLATHGGVAIGVGVGPFANEGAEKACQEFLNKCEFVGLRDVESFECAKQLAPNANLELTFDLAPALLCGNFQLPDVERSGIAFNLCPVKSFDIDSEESQKRIRDFKQVIENVWYATGEKIYLLDINGHSELGDSTLHHKLMLSLSRDVQIEHIGYDPNPYNLLQRLASYKAIASMRLHGSILGYMAQTPVLNLQYHSKCAGWSNQIKHPVHLRFDVNNLSIDGLTFALIDGWSHGFSMPEVTCASAIRHSLNNWKFCHEHKTASDNSCYSFV